MTELTFAKDLSFLRAFVREGDLQSAVTISLVLWNSIKRDESAKKEVLTWLECFFDLLSREECYEELVSMREICSIIGVPVFETYVGLSAWSERTETRDHLSNGDEAGRRVLPPVTTVLRFGRQADARGGGAADGRDPVHCDGREGRGVAGEKERRAEGEAGRNKAMDAGVPRSRMETSFCSVCQAKNQGLVAMCLRCGHGGHLKHIREWFSDDVNNRRRKCAIVTCQCHCVFVEENGNSVQWRVCFRRALSLFRYAEAKGAFFVWIFLVHTGSLHDLLAVFQYPTSCLVL